MSGLSLMILMLAATGVVVVRCLCLVAHLNPRRFSNKFRMAGLSLAYALVCGGSVGTLFGWHPGAALLLCGIASLIVFERRMWR
jgi:hypothetical protein